MISRLGRLTGALYQFYHFERQCRPNGGMVGTRSLEVSCGNASPTAERLGQSGASCTGEWQC
jgi:hypothetical protein